MITCTYRTLPSMITCTYRELSIEVSSLPLHWYCETRNESPRTQQLLASSAGLSKSGGNRKGAKKAKQQEDRRDVLRHVMTDEDMRSSPPSPLFYISILEGCLLQE